MPQRETDSTFPINSDTSLAAIIFGEARNFKEKIDLIRTRYNIRSSGLTDLVLGWELQGDPTEVIRSLGGKKVVVDKFLRWQNLENADKGQKEGHQALTSALFSNALLPLISAINTSGKLHKDHEAVRDANAALFFLNEALDIIFRNPDFQDNLIATFSGMQTDSFYGNSSDLQDFFTLMKIARITAVETIVKHGEKQISLDPKIPVPPPTEKYRGNFKALRDLAIAEFASEQGAKFPEDFAERVQKSKVVVVSLDWNSTWNQSESYANGFLIAITSTILRNLADNFQITFPEKQIYFVINTGRPALYAWGVIEALQALKQLRVFGLTESGAVILKQGMHKGEFALALSMIKDSFVPDPYEWKEELQNLLSAFQSQLPPNDEIKNEKKESALALRIYDEQFTNGWIHTDKDGFLITPNYLTAFTDKYLTETSDQTEKQLIQALQEEGLISTSVLTLSQMVAELTKGPDEIIGTADDMSLEKIIFLENSLSELKGEKAQKAKKLARKLKVIKYMQSKLEEKYNPTAGFMDFFHTDINKYSTLRLVLEQLGYQPENSVICHIGDSGSDIMPENKTGEGEVNEGVDDVLLIGVGNSSKSYRQAVEKRTPRGRGLIITRNAILGLMDMLTGLNNLITNIRNSRIN